jgi:hypothetical protein
MWVFNNDYQKWYTNDDKLSLDNFNYLKQELSATRFYSKCLSGATYLPINSTDNLYDILGEWQPRNWYIPQSSDGSQYSRSLIPAQHATPIGPTTSYEYYQKYLPEYGLTLKNQFTPSKLIKESVKNYIYIDVATTGQIVLNSSFFNLSIDGVRLIDNQRVLIKDQKSSIVLDSSTDPETYFKGNYTIIQNLGTTIEYEFYNSENGIYIYNNNTLTKETDLDDYQKCIRFSVSVKLGSSNTGRQFHLSRLNNGYYPSSLNDDPMEFIEKKNWLLRNRVDYNNLFEINYYDVVKHGEQSYTIDDVVYSIPERTISVGEFGVILNTQVGISNIINNKYKVNLRSISQTSAYYWICGDDGILLKVRKHDFNIERIEVDCSCPRNIVITNLMSISFFNDLRGVAVGQLNTILVTIDGGNTWKRLRIYDFDSYNFNKVIYTSLNTFYLGGSGGTFIEMVEDINGWIANKRRISRFIDDDDEYILVDHINDLYHTTITTWGLTYSYLTQSISSTKEVIFITTNDNKLIVHDINNSIPNFDFIYLNFTQDHKDITNIVRKEGTNNFYFTATDDISGDPSLLSFNINNFQSIGVGNSYSNTIQGATATVETTNISINRLFDYVATELLICGNTSLLQSSTYSTSFNFQILDPTFESKLKSKLLFLDYDIASKLNFFTDAGDYRLPNSLTFSSASFSIGSYLGFSPLIIAATAPSYMTQSQPNWVTYWTDTVKTFEFYSTTNPLDESTKVLMSTTFSYNSLPTTWSITDISASASSIINLAPTILDPSSSRFSGIGLTAISTPSSSHQIYLYDYLMVFRSKISDPINVGDVMRLTSNIADGDFVVNKSVTFGSYKYNYMFTDFNQNIITDLSTTTYSVTLTNLNSYSTYKELIERFNSHPISNAYGLTESGSYLELSPKFNNITSYYNLSTSVNLSGGIDEMVYTNGFLNFGYSPTYNILDYLESINNPLNPNPVFTANKELYAMPEYRGIPLDDNDILLPGSLTPSMAHIDTLGLTYSNTFSTTGNRITFGTDLKFEWDSIFINTFVDVNIYGSSTYSTTRLLVMNKYYDSVNSGYVIEFHKKLNFTLGDIGGGSLDIISRRKLYQISEDLQELNNIQRARLKTKEVYIGSTFTNYEPELNFKISTDSYTKILLSDSDFVQSLTGVIYIDYKNELAMNVTRLGKEMNVPISNTSNFIIGTSSNLFISCSQKHDLSTGEGVVLEFTGGTGSSQVLNQQYFGYHPVIVVNDYNFYVDIPYGSITLIGNDSGYVKYTKSDPFFNYQPVDIIDIGVDKKGKIAIELNVENLKLTSNTWSLVNVDYSKYRYRLVDGLNVETISLQYPWILEAEISEAILGVDANGLVWYKGTWDCGRWFGGTWISGTWVSGDWYSGIWKSLTIKDNFINIEVDEKSSNITQSTWFNGRWFGGTWNNGLWVNGRWYDGTWNNGLWYKGIWNDGTWNNGRFIGGIWVLGTWNSGVFNTDNEPAYWIDGKWYGGDFENGMWYNGLWEEKFQLARFGVNAYSSRTANWQGGKWVSGSFYSGLDLDSSGNIDVSISHKFSIWKTGTWMSGDWYGGVAYNMDFKSGTWWGGILEDIQIIGMDATDNYFVVNGIFKFNIGDEFTVIDNQVGGTYSTYGSNTNPTKYKVLYTVEDTINKWTNVYVNYNITDTVIPAIDGGIRIVSRFNSTNWKSGVWTNGIYESGYWEGGIWYNGVFEATWM